MSYRWVCLAVLVAGCQFDASGASQSADANGPAAAIDASPIDGEIDATPIDGEIDAAPVDAARPDAAPPDAAPPDAAPPDAAPIVPDAEPMRPDAGPGCADDDGDGALASTEPGAICEPADCDDDDDRVYPGQSGAFTSPKSSGDFDYDCDGVEEKLSDTTLGDGCHREIFGPCEGTGWLGSVPACGELGTWHRCESGIFSCSESERVDAVMPCH